MLGLVPSTTLTFQHYILLLISTLFSCSLKFFRRFFFTSPMIDAPANDFPLALVFKILLLILSKTVEMLELALFLTVFLFRI